MFSVGFQSTSLSKNVQCIFLLSFVFITDLEKIDVNVHVRPKKEHRKSVSARKSLIGASLNLFNPFPLIVVLIPPQELHVHKSPTALVKYDGLEPKIEPGNLSVVIIITIAKDCFRLVG